ncbi:MAG: protein BatD, partial [candidate division Zixibacteria bacterium]|nr:protein BatD [candidate division Zixibacteria bacterium]
YYQNINGRRYSIIEIKTALFPTRSGDLNIGQAMLSVNVKSKSRQRRDPFGGFGSFFDRGESKTIRSRPLTIKVLPLPTKSKPNNFSGTVGEFFITSSADKLKTEVNQPITVTYKINGTGNIKTIAEPEIDDLVDFRVYRSASSEKVSKVEGVVGGTKLFEETYIPKRAGKLTIPAVSLNYFNPRTKKYKTVSTKPFDINVEQAALSEYADIPVPNVSGRVIDSKAKDIRYIKTESGNLDLKKPLILATPLYLILNGIPVLLLALVWIGQKRREKLSTDIGYARSRLARKLARKRLATARKLAGSQQVEEFYAEIRFALFAYIADKLNISPHGMTGDKLLDIMESSDVESEIISKTKSLLRQADFAQYSSSDKAAEDIKQSLKSAEEILVKLEGAEIA